MKNNTTKEDVRYLSFEINVPTILRLYIEKCYEEICESDIPHEYVEDEYYDEDEKEIVKYTYDSIEDTINQIQAQCDVYPLYNVIEFYQIKPDDELMNEFTEYMCELYPDIENVNLEIKDMKNFAKAIYENYKQTEDYRDARIKNMLRLHDMYVFDKYSKSFEFVNMGGHFGAIQKFVVNYLLNNVDNLKDIERLLLNSNNVPKSMYPIADKFIAENIVIKGNYDCEKLYRFEVR